MNKLAALPGPVKGILFMVAGATFMVGSGLYVLRAETRSLKRVAAEPA